MAKPTNACIDGLFIDKIEFRSRLVAKKWCHKLSHLPKKLEIRMKL